MHSPVRRRLSYIDKDKVREAMQIQKAWIFIAEYLLEQLSLARVKVDTSTYNAQLENGSKCEGSTQTLAQEVQNDNDERGSKTNESENSLSPEGTAPAAQSYPTEQSIRQKAARKQQREDLEKQRYTKEEIKQMLGKKPQIQEEVYKDCGSDSTPLDNDEGHRSLLCYSGKTAADVLEYCFGESAVRKKGIARKLSQFVDGNFHLHYLLGPPYSEDWKLLKGAQVVHGDIHSFQVDVSDTAENSFDLLAVFAGEGGTTRLAIRRCLKCGRCVDFQQGSDLTWESEQKKLIHYVRERKPLWIVGGPPCSTLAN